MFVLMIGGDKTFANQTLYPLFTEYLSSGYTFQDIKNEIFTSFYSNKEFRWYMFHGHRKKGDEKLLNLLSPEKIYYHKELKLVSKPPVIDRDIDRGIIVSRTPEHFLEPVASYTIQELIQYFCNTMPLNMQEWHYKKLLGMIKYKVDQFGIDKLLFMTDIAAADHKANGTVFNLGSWDEYSEKADQYINEMKYSISDNESYYTIKKRNIFNG